MTLKKKLLVSMVLSIMVLLAVNFGLLKYKNSFDLNIMEKIHGNITLFGKSVMEFISFLGSHLFIGICIVISCIYFFYQGHKLDSLFIVLTSILASALNLVIKYYFKRPRPEAYMLVDQRGYSFPSGHSMGAFVFYTSIFFILTLKKPKYKELFLALNFIIVGTIGFSRLYLGVHWPTDVLTGFLLGYTCYLASKALYLSFRDKKHYKNSSY